MKRGQRRSDFLESCGWSRWQCRCGEVGYAPGKVDAFRCWRLHHNARHRARLLGAELRDSVQAS